MLKYINIFLVSLIIIIVCYIVYDRFIIYTNEIPNFDYANVKTDLKFTNNDIFKNKETIIAYVSTKCGSCEDVVRNINDSVNSNKNYIIVTTENEIKDSKEFFNKFKLDEKIIILNDKNSDFIKDFELGISVIYPTIFLFDEDRKQIEVIHDF